jgi:hypothetical protein
MFLQHLPTEAWGEQARLAQGDTATRHCRSLPLAGIP